MQYEDRDGARWITLTGELDQSDVLNMKAEYDAAVESAEGDIVLEMGQVSFVGTLGIGLFLATRAKLEKDGHHLQLANVPEPVESALKLLNLDELFERV